ncbi:MAG: hypothetical protein CM1200mP3_06080 [Chloroflexota bacterium]|nr:MAG: hypothetical protein CM1200mP3_06080 [Chloroflexota bacterium]
MAFRYLCMTARYRTRINFTFTSLKASEKALHKLRRIFINVRDVLQKDYLFQTLLKHGSLCFFRVYVMIWTCPGHLT